jgi:hypothetical protein
VFDGVADEIAARGVVHHVEVQRVASCGQQKESSLRTHNNLFIQHGN